MKDPRELKRIGLWYSYILDSIDGCTEADELGITFKDDKERVEFFLERFNEDDRNSDYEKRRTPSLQSRIADFIRDMPSCINVYTYYFDIIRITKEWEGYTSVQKGNYYCNNWFDLLAMYILQLACRFGIKLSKYE